MLLGVIAPLSATVVSAALSYDKASVYVKISVVTSFNSVKETPGENLSGDPDKETFEDNFSILVEGTTEEREALKSTYKQGGILWAESTNRC